MLTSAWSRLGYLIVLILDQIVTPAINALEISVGSIPDNGWLDPTHTPQPAKIGIAMVLLRRYALSV
jgi:hypothetical protein